MAPICRIFCRPCVRIVESAVAVVTPWRNLTITRPDPRPSIERAATSVAVGNAVLAEVAMLVGGTMVLVEGAAVPVGAEAVPVGD